MLIQLSSILAEVDQDNQTPRLQWKLLASARELDTEAEHLLAGVFSRTSLSRLRVEPGVY